MTISFVINRIGVWTWQSLDINLAQEVLKIARNHTMLVIVICQIPIFMDIYIYIYKSLGNQPFSRFRVGSLHPWICHGFPRPTRPTRGGRGACWWKWKNWRRSALPRRSCWVDDWWSGWWFATWIWFSPILGMTIQSDFHIFQGGWNHRLVILLTFIDYNHHIISTLV